MSVPVKHYEGGDGKRQGFGFKNESDSDFSDSSNNDYPVAKKRKIMPVEISPNSEDEILHNSENRDSDNSDNSARVTFKQFTSNSEVDSANECEPSVENSFNTSRRSYHSSSGEEDYGFTSFGSTKVNRDISTGSCDKTSNISSNNGDMPNFSVEGKGRLLLEKMGWVGTGLGKHKQGRINPVEAAVQRGRRGIGHHIPGFQESSLKYDPSREVVNVIEDIKWIKSNYPCTLNSEEIIEKDWITLGSRKDTMDDEYNFCEPIIVNEVLNSKRVLDHLDNNEIRQARTRCNPFETIRSSIFLNRAAVKMANIDRACDFMFTRPRNLRKNELLYFADVCAGPGGFSEYVLWRKKWHAKGFGFTLRGENDFKLDQFFAGPPDTFHPYYGPKDNGNVYDPENQEEYKNLIMKHTNNVGVHFMMSDGGFSVDGQELLQETLSKQLYLCQCLVALMIVRTGGHFVTKLFDVFTPFSAGLVYIMYRCFESISIFKPNTSRPANSERYLICRGKRNDTSESAQYLKCINELLLKNDAANDVLEIVPLKVLQADEEFMNYLVNSNIDLGQRQVIALSKTIAYCQDSTLVEVRQGELRKKCLKYWEINDEARTVPRSINPQELIKEYKTDFEKLSTNMSKLTRDNLKTSPVLNTPYDWYYMPCTLGNEGHDMHRGASFYLGTGGMKVFRYDNGRWVQVSADWKVSLPAKTLVYGELVYEMIKERRCLQRIPAFHILDAYLLGGEDVSKEYIEDRHKLARIFCEALWKPINNYTRLRVRDMFPLRADIDRRLQLIPRHQKNNSLAMVYPLKKSYLEDAKEDEVPYIIPNHIIFFKSTAVPWSRHYSKTYSKTYVFNSKRNEQYFDYDRPKEAEANFLESFQSCITLKYPNNNDVPLEMLKHHIKLRCPELSDNR